jgi:Flp pilus assembly protein TadB
MKVRAADGRVWTVRRSIRWPRRRDFGDTPNLTDVALLPDVPSGIGDAVATLLIGLIFALVVATVIVVFLPLVIFVFEAVAVVVAAVALRRPWLVAASTQARRLKSGAGSFAVSSRAETR